MRLALIALLLAAAEVRAAEVVVVQKDKSFGAEVITVRRGDKLVFKNEDPITHNVFSQSPGSKFNLKAQAPGASSSVIMENEGTVEVRCAFHPRMKLTVVVKQ